MIFFPLQYLNATSSVTKCDVVVWYSKFDVRLMIFIQETKTKNDKTPEKLTINPKNEPNLKAIK